ncbi:hypothetical protein Pcinc_035929 [Petrolisthes cinctipes]|uniref:Uncharacterized protein n=1 Tax=Petrolisthes cinctipes TaxID=88211 RepID=A0AAE1BYS0_PETCI|nr:hypothetical protein Pcinc_035929 [Petrolisthes cinctipes]
MPPLNIQKQDSLKLRDVNNMEGSESEVRANLSHQELLPEPGGIVAIVPEGGGGTTGGGVAVEGRIEQQEDNDRPPPYTRRQIAMVAVLCFVNLINYMDRMTVAGKLG